MALFTFKGGVHPPENKKVTEDLKIEEFKAPKLLYVSLLQHIGVPLQPLVKIGDEVKIGQKIGESESFLSVPVHASVSGKVIKIETHPYAVSGKIKTIIIENNFKEEWIELQRNDNYAKLSSKELLDIIKDKGIVGMGGAAFPTFVKLNPPKDKIIDTLLINGAECEPYLNADNRLMLEHPKEIIEGIKIILKVLGVKKAVVGIEANKEGAIEKFEELTKDISEIEIGKLKTKYPQGGEKQLIKALLNREVPSKELPAKVGVVVQNIGTAKAIYDAVVLGIPLIERVLTVSGATINKPRNLSVRIGTQFKEVLEYCEFDKENTAKLIMGGPMMGTAQFTDEVAVIKGTSGILGLSKKEIKSNKVKSCISCGKCVNACPVNLMPLMFAKLARFEQWEEMEKYNLIDCIVCGTCAFVCPANRPLTEAIRIGKAKLRTVKK